MSTFYDPATIRRLADAGDPFYKGAAWILDQQAADLKGKARAHRQLREIEERLDEKRTMARDNYDDPWTATPNAADLGAPRVP